jgi:hypothetical protein
MGQMNVIKHSIYTHSEGKIDEELNRTIQHSSALYNTIKGILQNAFRNNIERI